MKAKCLPGILVTCILLVAIGFMTLAQQPTELLQNGGFEQKKSLSPWIFESTKGGVTVAKDQPYDGNYYVLLGGTNNETDSIEQAVIIPGDATACNLAFALRIKATGNDTTPHDFLHVRISGSDGSWQDLAQYSNANACDWTVVQPISVLGLAGQLVTVRFEASTDGTKPTKFGVDDVSLRYMPGGTGPTPDLEFYSPTRGCLQPIPLSTLAISGSAPLGILGWSPKGVKTISVSVDDKLVGIANGPTFQVPMDWTRLTPGVHSLTATLTDLGGIIIIKRCQISSTNLLEGADFQGYGPYSWYRNSSAGSSLILQNTPAQSYDGTAVAILGSNSKSTDSISQAIPIPPDAQDTMTLSFFYKTPTAETVQNPGSVLSIYFTDAATNQGFLAATAYPSSAGWMLFRVPISLSGLGLSGGKDYFIKFQVNAPRSNATPFYLDDIALYVNSAILASGGTLPDCEGDSLENDTTGSTVSIQVGSVHRDVPGTCDCRHHSHATITLVAQGFGTLTLNPSPNFIVKFWTPDWQYFSKATITDLQPDGNGYDIKCTVPDSPDQESFKKAFIQVKRKDGTKHAHTVPYSVAPDGTEYGFRYGLPENVDLTQLPAQTISTSIEGGETFSATIPGLQTYTTCSGGPMPPVVYAEDTSDPPLKVQLNLGPNCNDWFYSGSWEKNKTVGMPVVCGTDPSKPCKKCISTGAPPFDVVFLNPDIASPYGDTCSQPKPSDYLRPFFEKTQPSFVQFKAPLDQPSITSISRDSVNSVGKDAVIADCSVGTVDNNFVTFSGTNIFRIQEVQSGDYGSLYPGWTDLGSYKDDGTDIFGTAPPYTESPYEYGEQTREKVAFKTADDVPPIYATPIPGSPDVLTYVHSWKKSPTQQHLCPNASQPPDFYQPETDTSIPWPEPPSSLWDVYTGKDESIDVIWTPSSVLANQNPTKSITLGASITTDLVEDYLQDNLLRLDLQFDSDTVHNCDFLIADGQFVAKGAYPAYDINNDLVINQTLWPLKVTYYDFPANQNELAATWHSSYYQNPSSPANIPFWAEIEHGYCPFGYGWDFGDGVVNFGSYPSVAHRYCLTGAATGQFTTKLAVQDALGYRDFDSNLGPMITNIGVPCSLSPMSIGMDVDPKFLKVDPNPYPVYISGEVQGGQGYGSTPEYYYEWIENKGYVDEQVLDSGWRVATPLDVKFAYYFKITNPDVYTITLCVTDLYNKLCTNPRWIDATCGEGGLFSGAGVFLSSGTVPVTAFFSSIAKGGKPPFTYYWTFGDGTSSSLQNPTHTYSAPGVFSARLTVCDSSGTPGLQSTKTLSIAANAPSSLTAGGSATPISGVAPLAVSLTGSASGGAAPYYYWWTFGDGGTSSTQNPAHTYSAAGNYTATLTVADSATPTHATATKTFTITVSAPGGLTCSASSYPTSGTAPLTVSFSGSATGGTTPYTYSWAFGDGGTSTSQNPSHTYNSAGTYTVTFTVTDAATHTCSKSLTITVSAPGMSCSASASTTSGTAPLTVNFTGSASGGTSPYSYSWIFGDGGTSTTQSPSHTFNSAGTYTVTFTVTDAASHTCTKSLTITVSAPGMSCSASASTTSGTAPLTVNFTGSASGGTTPYTYSWTFGDGGSSTSQNPSHTYNSAGTFTVALTVTDAATHSCSKSLTVTVYAPLTCTATGSPVSGNVPLTVNFSGSASGGASPYTYDWNFGDGSSHSSAQNPSHPYSAPGTYTATLTVHDSATQTCTKSVTITATGVTCNASANPLTGPAPLLVWFSSSPSGGMAPYTFSWSFGDGSPVNAQQNPSHYYNPAGTYTAQLTVHDSSSPQLSCSQSLVIVVGSSFSANASATPSSGQTPLVVTFTGSPTGTYTGPLSWLWNFGDGTPTSAMQTVSHIYPFAGSYTVNLTVTDSFSTPRVATQTLTITVTPGSGYSISGTIATALGAGVGGVSVSLTGAASSTVTTDMSGNYVFSNLSNGSYRVTPVVDLYYFSPSYANISLSGVSQAGINFTAKQYFAMGQVTTSLGVPVAGIQIDAASSSGVTDDQGNYVITDLAPGDYTFKPNKKHLGRYKFTPSERSAHVGDQPAKGVDFKADPK